MKNKGNQMIQAKDQPSLTLAVNKYIFELHIGAVQFTPEAYLFEVPEETSILNAELPCTSSHVPLIQHFYT